MILGKAIALSSTSRDDLKVDKDLSVIPRVQSFRRWLGEAVAIIDATRPEDVNDFPERNRIPEETVSRIRNRFENFSKS